MKKRIFAALLAFSTACCYAQEQTPVVTSVTKATFLNPGISYERPFGKKQTLFVQGYLSTSAYFMYSEALGTSGGVYLDPALTAQYRFYYNLANRQAAGKRTALNSANYISPLADLTFVGKHAAEYYEVPSTRTVFTLGGVWGLQRNFAKRFSLDLNLGVGYYFTKHTYRDEFYGGGYTKWESDATPIAKINLGFWLNKRKEN